MRRFLSSILAILVLVLSCLPCSDVEAAPRVEGKQMIFKSANDSHHCGDSDAHACSPFCTCSCCAGITIPTPVQITLSMFVRAVTQHTSFWSAEMPPEVHLPIWQPPKLG